jgi:hypothetical protein
MKGERTVAREALFYEFSPERHVPGDHLVCGIDRSWISPAPAPRRLVHRNRRQAAAPPRRNFLFISMVKWRTRHDSNV